MADATNPTPTPTIQPDRHRGWFDSLADLHRRIACEADDEGHEALTAEAVELERLIGTTPAQTVDGIRVQLSLAQILAGQEGAEAVVFGCLTLAQDAIGRMEAKGSLVTALDVVQERVDRLGLAVSELISDVERGR